MTRYLGVPAAKAQLEMRRYVPTPAELSTKDLSRPFFETASKSCPYCGAASKWHAHLSARRIESSKSSDTARRALFKSLKEPSYAVVEEKATQQHAFFRWIERISAGLDLDDPQWLLEASRHYLARKEPKTDWDAIFPNVRAIRRSRRLEDGWEADGNRLFLAPFVFDELLLVQYLLSRAHRAGGLTFEGRYTLPELFSRLRNSGYLRHVEVDQHNASNAFEQLIEHLGGGESSQKLYYVVDRRDLLAKIKALKDLRVPKNISVVK
jgi:hypothetical protein